MTCRVLVECVWSPDGHSEFRFAPGTVVSDDDPRLANGFFVVARRRGWVEVIAEAQPSPASAIASPARVLLSPAAREVGPSVRKKAAPKRKPRAKKPVEVAS